MGVGEVNNLSDINILENPFFLDFADIHKDLDCKYHDETSFTNSFNNSPTNFLAISMNIRSLPNKFTDLTNLLDRYRLNNFRPDLICLQEAWQANIASLNIENYTLFSSLRATGARGGGVCCYLNNLFHGTVLKEGIFIQNHFESLAIKVVIPGVSQQIAVCLYRPPNANNTIFLIAWPSCLILLGSTRYRSLSTRT